MANSLAQKLKIPAQATLLALHAPDSFESHLAPLPEGVQVKTNGNEYQQIHWFVKTKAEMEKELDQVLKMLHDAVVCWIYYPKGTSSLQTDLTRDKGWEALLGHDELKWISLISFDDTWSAFGMRLKSAADKASVGTTKLRPIFEYADPATKSIRLPEDLAKALEGDQKAMDHFDSLSFSNKKEYVEWIVTAKREDTRQQRITASLEKLNQKWKNPRNV